MNEPTRLESGLLDELSAEHNNLLPELTALVELARRGDGDLAAAVDRIAPRLGAELQQHIAREDNELFPFFARETGDAGLVAVFVEEHREIERHRDALLKAHGRGAASAELARLVEPLADLLTTHMNREDQMLFPATRDLLH